jgi:hypothetical protein
LSGNTITLSGSAENERLCFNKALQILKTAEGSAAASSNSGTILLNPIEFIDQHENSGHLSLLHSSGGNTGQARSALMQRTCACKCPTVQNNFSEGRQTDAQMQHAEYDEEQSSKRGESPHSSNSHCERNGLKR